MDHETAVRIQAAERYVLEEFPPEERTAFEEHFFDCPECADEVRSATIFSANATQALRQQRARGLAKLASPAGHSNRRFWWKLAASAGLNLALLAGLGLERFRSNPISASVEPEFYSTVAIAPASRGSQSAAILPKGAHILGLRFDLMPGQQFQNFGYQILDSKGTILVSKSLPAPQGESSELQLAVPIGSLEPGQYVLVLLGNSTEIGRRSFSTSR